MPDPSTAMPDPNAALPAPTDTEVKTGPKQPKRGDFDAGGKLRFPSGPDEEGMYDSFNWVALDANGRYFLLDSVTVNGLIPMAVKKPDTVGPMGPEPSIFGGIEIRLEGKWTVPKMPIVKQETELGLMLGAAYMRDGAMLLSDKDFPLFTGDFNPGLKGGIITKVKLSSLLDFSLIPVFAFQKGDMENLTALQLPMSLIVKLGDVLKLSADAGVFTGDDISLSADNGGRIYLGAALDVKIWKLVFHAGAGFASLLTSSEPGALYPGIKDSLYVDLNVKYAK